MTQPQKVTCQLVVALRRATQRGKSKLALQPSQDEAPCFGTRFLGATVRDSMRATVATVEVARATLDPDVIAYWSRIRLPLDVPRIVVVIKGEDWRVSTSELLAVSVSGR